MAGPQLEINFMKSKLLFEREDGYREYWYKDQKIWYMDGYYMPEHWGWTKKFTSLEQIEQAIDQA